MAISGLPIFEMLKARMHWQQARQKLLAENVANADTPRFQPRDLVEPARSAGVGAALAVARTSAAHLEGNGRSGPDGRRPAGFATRVSGGAVVLEDEMLKAAQNQADHQMAVTLYARSLALLKTAVGRS